MTLQIGLNVLDIDDFYIYKQSSIQNVVLLTMATEPERLRSPVHTTDNS